VKVSVDGNCVPPQGAAEFKGRYAGWATLTENLPGMIVYAF
jgi:hypothetical protein